MNSTLNALTGKAAIGQAENSGHRGRVGIITNNFCSSYYGQMVEAATDYLSARGYQSIVQSNQGSHRGEQLACSSLEELECNGLIIHADVLTDDELVEIFDRYDNTVLLNRKLNQYAERSVYSDNLAGGALAARCLLDHCHTNIAMIRGPRRFFEANERSIGFAEELARHDLAVLIDVEGKFTEESGAACMASILDSGHDITAVFAHSDEMAFGAMNICRERGIKIPDDLSVIGYDGLPICEYVCPKLTTIQQPLSELGVHAGRIMAGLLTGDKQPPNSTSNLYDPILVERESVAPPNGHAHVYTELTHRELQCLSWTARGKTAWEISVILSISESTSTFHLRNAAVKLKASNRTHAVAKAMHQGLISLSGTN